MGREEMRAEQRRINWVEQTFLNRPEQLYLASFRLIQYQTTLNCKLHIGNEITSRRLSVICAVILSAAHPTNRKDTGDCKVLIQSNLVQMIFNF